MVIRIISNLLSNEIHSVENWLKCWSTSYSLWTSGYAFEEVAEEASWKTASFNMEHISKSFLRIEEATTNTFEHFLQQIHLWTHLYIVLLPRQCTFPFIELISYFSRLKPQWLPKPPIAELTKYCPFTRRTLLDSTEPTARGWGDLSSATVIIPENQTAFYFKIRIIFQSVRWNDINSSLIKAYLIFLHCT
jgi:hypothetical protein